MHRCGKSKLHFGASLRCGTGAFRADVGVRPTNGLRQDCQAHRRRARESTLYVMSTKRRTFLQQVALAGAAAQSDANAQTPAAPGVSKTPSIAYPRTFTGRHLTAIA